MAEKHKTQAAINTQGKTDKATKHKRSHSNPPFTAK